MVRSVQPDGLVQAKNEEADPLVNPKTGLRFKVPVIGARKPRTRVVRKAAKGSDGESPKDLKYERPIPARVEKAEKKLKREY